MKLSSANKAMLVLVASVPVAAWAGIICAIPGGIGKDSLSYGPDWIVSILLIAALISPILGIYIALRAIWIPNGRFRLLLYILCGFTFTPVPGLFLPALIHFCQIQP
jgi:hypothetical protein